MKKILLHLTLMTILSACASNESIQYFTLPDSQYIQPLRNSQPIAVRIVLAEPLQNEGLAYQTDDYHINFAHNHLWAGNLNSALAASFSNKLNRLNPNYTFIPAQRSQTNQTLKIYIEAFQGSHHGKTNVNGYAIWPNGNNRPFNETTPQQGDGYAAMVESLNQGVEQAAQKIAY